ncbi:MULTISPECIES: LppU/SCO3897 family protein [Mycobacterium]|uniref:Uncharacterized protein n=3 Tax=Mycobacterium avium complex (MAC) TaxID=120793 RepID=J9W696_MYCIP|nr:MULTISPECIES: hypothetical protein [Mycobacterium]AFS12554.1 Hypothetical protein MIP_00814 [Mycobacterium intracellulare subsp. intracellulare MTCC 9506]WSE51023.1 hypothetical protein QGN31_23440 [Mycobacterium sp. 2-64]BCO50133.1 hypothetical protein MINTM003_05740 [Mycobacterium paraintracellulare]
MVVAYLALDESPAVLAGRLMFLLGLPATGLTLLIIGLARRSRARRQTPPLPPPYHPGYPYPPPPPGYPGPYPTPPPYPGYPPRPAAGKSGTALIAVGAVLLALSGLAILGKIARFASHDDRRGSHTIGQASTSGSAAVPKVGQCFSEFEVRMGSLKSPSDCANPVATFELAADEGPTATCPDGKRDGSVYSRLTNNAHTLCFIANLIEGHCYLQTDPTTTATWTPADCDNPRLATFKVFKRIDGSVDETHCPAGTKANSYPSPARVYCLARAG